MVTTSSHSSDAADFLIVGGGVAGLRAAIALAAAGRVLVLTKADPTESNTGYAQGGIAAAVGKDDSPELHLADTLRAGDGLCDEAAVRVLVEEAPTYIRELLAWGARFDLDAHGQPALGLEAAHSVRRILHAGDATGREIARTLWRQASTLSGIATINHALVTDLIVEDGVAAGVRFFDQAGNRRSVRASATLLATGGAGQVYSETTNPTIATGDGVALAYHAGARVADLEFVQFHPTALNLPGAPRFLISEAVRGEGAQLINRHGEPFMARYHPDGDLAPRDIVARAIVREMERTGGPVFLTVAHLPAEQQIRARFPTIAETCGKLGLDLARDRIPVGPAAHYFMGGIDTDEGGRTSVPGLYAAGETACTGVHGANRLASNSLLEGLVFGARAGGAMQQPARAAVAKADRMDGNRCHVRLPELMAHAADVSSSPLHPDRRMLDITAVRRLMWESAGLFRSRAGLEAAARQLEIAHTVECARLQRSTFTVDEWRDFNLLTVARLTTRAALRRQESRGGHFRADFPSRDDLHWAIHVCDHTSHPCE